MNTATLHSLKTFACTLAALAVTTVFSWSFVDSTSVLRWVGNSVAVASLTAAGGNGLRGASAAATALLN